MQEKIETHIPVYTSPECTLIRLGKDDVVATSSIHLPIHPLDGEEYYYNNPGISAD